MLSESSCAICIERILHISTQSGEYDIIEQQWYIRRP